MCKVIFNAFEEIKTLYESNENPAAFLSLVISVLAPWKKVQLLLEELDSWVDTSNRSDSSSQGPGVGVMTFQGAKGLEADVVCVIGLEDGIMPRRIEDKVHLAEQSRLMFVTMTRAREELHLFHARTRSAGIMFRSIHKKGAPPDINPSCFIKAIPDEHKEGIYHKV